MHDNNGCLCSGYLVLGECNCNMRESIKEIRLKKFGLKIEVSDTFLATFGEEWGPPVSTSEMKGRWTSGVRGVESRWNAGVKLGSVNFDSDTVGIVATYEQSKDEITLNGSPVSDLVGYNIEEGWA